MKTQKRETVIIFRLSHDEKKQIIEMVSSQDFDSISSFLRYQIFKKQTAGFSRSEKKHKRSYEEISDLLGKEIKRIGQNINQVVKKINGTFGVTDLIILLEKILFEQKQIEKYFDITNQNIKSLK